MSWREDFRATLGDMGPPALAPEAFFHAVMLALGPVPDGNTKHLQQWEFDRYGPLSDFVYQYDKLRKQLCAGILDHDYYTGTERPYSVRAYRQWYEQQEIHEDR